MSTLTIIYEPAVILRTTSKEVLDVHGSEIQELILDMIAAMEKVHGVGLAASQINKAIRLIIVRTKNEPIACINPIIIKKSILKEWVEEGCLSVPGSYGIVKRHRNITVKFTDKNGDLVVLKTYGLLAQIFQHEIDHINGVLFIDKAKNLHQYK